MRTCIVLWLLPKKWNIWVRLRGGACPFGCSNSCWSPALDPKLLRVSTRGKSEPCIIGKHSTVVVCFPLEVSSYAWLFVLYYRNLPKISPPSKISPPPSLAESYCKGSLLFKSTPTPQTRLATHFQMIRMSEN